ncbi:MAG TPA: extracellular solute-binding protein [Halanaerobiales bacterium]|nr:extracellular solute-binding protein [Halanaerobiales bacterium]
MQDTTLRIWLIVVLHKQDTLFYLREKFSLFEEKHDVNIQLQFVNWERVWPSLIEAYKNNEVPDIVHLGTSWARTFIHLRYLDRVPDNIKIKSSINEGINKICRYNGVQYAVPWTVDTIIMAGRKDLMKKFGISPEDVKDWPGLKNTVEELSKKRKRDPDIPKPLSIALIAERDTLQRFFSMLWSRGWEFPLLEEFPQRILADSEVLETMKYYIDLKKSSDSVEEIEKHPYQVNEEFYLHGQSIFYLGSWYGIVERINREDQDNEDLKKYCVLPFPAAIEGAGSYGGGTVLGVSSRSRHKEKAWKLVEYLLSDEIIRKSVEMGNVPAFDDRFWQKRENDQRVRLMYEQTIKSKVYPVHPAWLSIENEIIAGLGNALVNLEKNRDDIDDRELFSILKKTDDRIKKILKMCWELK